MSSSIDIHVHSWASGDSDADPEEMILRAVSRGLHGIAFTEHYSYGASEPVEVLRERYRNEILVLRGVEFSSAEGHCLIFGLDTDKLLSKYAPLAEIVQIVNQRGGVVIPSHPYRGIESIGDVVRSVSGICAVEGHNGCILHTLNMRAVEAATALGLPFTGGSDAHDPSGVGLCYTEFQDRVTHDNFIGLLKAGKYQGVDTRKISKVSFPFIRGLWP